MSVDKLVDSTQLDADLTSVANAIRTKGGTSAQLAFPADFVTAINDISGGGGDPDENLQKRITNTLTSYEITLSSLSAGAFMGCSNLTDLSFPQNIALNGDAIFQGAGPSTLHLHHATFNGYSIFRDCSNLTTFVCENGTIGSRYFYLLYSCANLKTIDIDIDGFKADMITGTTKKVDTLILRKTNALVTLNQVQNLANQNAFKSGGTGGTIYIPKALYDHLGDGGSLDYKAATNWSTVDGYGTITWAAIEGSVYETQYADGTPIS